MSTVQDSIHRWIQRFITKSRDTCWPLTCNEVLNFDLLVTEWYFLLLIFWSVNVRSAEFLYNSCLLYRCHISYSLLEIANFIFSGFFLFCFAHASSIPLLFVLMTKGKCSNCNNEWEKMFESCVWQVWSMQEQVLHWKWFFKWFSDTYVVTHILVSRVFYHMYLITCILVVKPCIKE